MRVAAVVLAAGEGRRMGGPKALARLGDTTFVSAAASRLARAGVAHRIVVIGADAERVLATAELPAAVTVVTNTRWGEGMLTSVWAGLDAAQALAAEAVLIHPVDNPLVAPETVDAVVAALASGARIAVPEPRGSARPPGGILARGVAGTARRRARRRRPQRVRGPPRVGGPRRPPGRTA